MKTQDIANKGPMRVKTRDGIEFMLSVIQQDGVTAILPFAIGSKTPRKGVHYLLPAFAREDYLAELEAVCTQKPS